MSLSELILFHRAEHHPRPRQHIRSSEFPAIVLHTLCTAARINLYLALTTLDINVPTNLCRPQIRDPQASPLEWYDPFIRLLTEAQRKSAVPPHALHEARPGKDEHAPHMQHL